MTKPRSPQRRPDKLVLAERLIAYVLRYGAILCAFVIGVGILFIFFYPSQRLGSSQVLTDLLMGRLVHAPDIPRSVGEFSKGLSIRDSNVVIAVGLILLIALPVARVGLTVVLFLLEGDFVYFAITAFVFVVLMAGIFLGRAW